MTRGTRAGDGFGEFADEYYVAGASAENLERHPEWVREVEIELTALRSSVAVTSGAPQQINGIDVEGRPGDGTITAVGLQYPVGAVTR